MYTAAMADGYLEVNRANWNSRVAFHAAGYGLERFRADPGWLSGVVQFDRPRLGDIAGLSGVHLQCHLGTDTLSLSRLGARMTGLDFSEPALDVARGLARDCGASIDYVAADVYQAVEALGEARFDLVYTGVGALCWLPRVAPWAKVVSRLLKPGGRLFLREGHPMLWTLCDPRPDQLMVVQFPYFETETGTEFTQPKTYVEHEGELSSPRSLEFNHGLGEIFAALRAAGLELSGFEEHSSVPWDAFGAAGVADELGEYRLRDRPERLAASYTLQAIKR
jgi:SAM-dependent methyltransferase